MRYFDPEWKNAIQFVKSTNFAKADLITDTVIEFSKHEPVDSELSKFLYELGDEYYKAERYKKALETTMRASEIDACLHGVESITLASDMYLLARIHEKLNHFSEAEAHYSRSLEIYQTVPGDHRFDTLNVLESLGSFYSVQRKTDLAESSYNKALSICEAIFGSSHSRTVNLKHSLQTLISAKEFKTGDVSSKTDRNIYGSFRSFFRHWSLRKTFATFLALVVVAFFSTGLPFLISNFKPEISFDKTEYVPVHDTQAYEAKGSEWEDFRTKYPYNFQMIGTKEYDDGSYLMIISEPPPHVTVGDFEKIFELFRRKNFGNNIFIEYKKQPIGYDGWLRDAVVCVSGINDEQWDLLISKLTTKLYFTDYKAKESLIPLPIPIFKPNYLYGDYNMQVSAPEIKKWFVDELDDIEAILPYGSDVETTLPKCFERSRSRGLYQSVNPGFIIWVIDKKSFDKTTFQEEARKFALDSDLIIGGIHYEKGGRDYVAIIARERQATYYELPPLRVETIVLLAATDEDELSQSYKRNHLFAGKLPDNHDYAPILLSNELWHTEYGNLLNITDQMLKSWSENGSIVYEKFDYELPVYWAFDESAMMDLGVSELTYNWNTTGTGYMMPGEQENSGMVFYALNRTGSLPVSYIPEGTSDVITEKHPVFIAEQNAYDFFSYLKNPELIRVVQYASLYQIFNNFKVRCNDKKTIKTVTSQCFVDGCYKILKEMWNNKDLEKQQIGSDQEFDNLLLCIKELQRKYDLNKTLDRRRLDFIVKFAVELGENHQNNWTRLIEEHNDKIFEFNQTHNLRQQSRISERIEVLRSAISVYEDAESLSQKIIPLVKLFNEFRSIYPLTIAKKEYLAENKNSYLTWCKCPTIVLSIDLVNPITVMGGHNLGAKLTPMRINPALKPGKPEIRVDNGKKVVGVAREVRARGDVISPPKHSQPSRAFNRMEHVKAGQKRTSFDVGEEKVTDGRSFVRALGEVDRQTANKPIRFTDRTATQSDVSIKMPDGSTQEYLIRKEGLYIINKEHFHAPKIIQNERIIEVELLSNQSSNAGIRLKIHIPDNQTPTKFREILDKTLEQAPPGEFDLMKELHRNLRKERGSPYNIEGERWDIVIKPRRSIPVYVGQNLSCLA